MREEAIKTKNLTKSYDGKMVRGRVRQSNVCWAHPEGRCSVPGEQLCGRFGKSLNN